MSNITADKAAQSQSPDTAAGQVKESVGNAVGQVQEQAQQARGQARERLSQELSTRSSQAGEQVRDAASALRETGSTLREQGKSGPAQTIDRVADHTDRFASYLTEANGDRMLRDVERFARQQPWAFTIGGVVAGFFASRFLKASSQQRFASSGPPQSAPQQTELPAGQPFDYGATTGGTPGVGGR